MLYLHFLGHFCLFEDEQIHPFAGLPKSSSLLAYLLLHRDKQVPREELATQLWPDLPVSKGKTNLRRHLHDLQSALPEAPEQQPWLLRPRGALQWNPEAPYWLDVAEFERLCLTPSHFSKAISFYRGDLLPQCYEDWIFPLREALRKKLFSALEQLVALCRQQQDISQALQYTEKILALDPYNEEVLRQFMQLCVQRKKRTEALKAYQSFAELISQELDAPPMPETTAMYEAIRDQDLSAIEELEATASAPKTPEKNSALHAFPTPINGFFGREDLLLQLVGSLSEPTPSMRWMTLTGPGGSGKTRLAIEVASQLRQRSPSPFPDGIFFVELSSVTEADEVPAHIGHSLPIDLQGAVLPQLKEWLQPRYLLLVLDNVEQIPDVSSVLEPLLAGAPGLRILVTSRFSLGAYGEYEQLVPPLALPMTDVAQMSDVMAEASQSSGVAMLLDRVRSHASGFSLTPENAPVIVELCQRLDGLPLAMELVAPRFRFFSPGQILEQLDAQLLALPNRAKGVVPRQKTLEGTIAWSDALLDELERKTLYRLSLFAGVFSSKDAAAVLFAGEDRDAEYDPLLAMDLLISLTEKNILHIVPQESEEGQPLFRMFQSVRDYARGKLASEPDVDELRLRHARWSSQLVVTEGFGGAAPWFLRRLQRYEADLKGAFAWLQEQGIGYELQAKLAADIGWRLHLHGRYEDAAESMARGVALAAEHGHHTLAAVIKIRLCSTKFTLRRADEALELLHEIEGALPSLALRPQDMVNLYHKKGGALGYLGRYDEALAVNEMSLALAEAHEIPDYMKALLYVEIASLHTSSGRYQEANANNERALALYQNDQTMANVGGLLNNMGDVARLEGNDKRAVELSRQALQLSLEIGDLEQARLNESNLGGALMRAGDLEQAIVRLEKVLASAPEGWFVLDETLRFLAEAYVLDGRIDEGIAHAKKALPLAEGWSDSICHLWRVLGMAAWISLQKIDIQTAEGTTLHSARDCFRKSIAVAEEHELLRDKAMVLWDWARCELDDGDEEAGREMWQEALGIFASLKLPFFIEGMRQERPTLSVGAS